MNGWWGKIARIDLSRKTVTYEALDPAICRRFIGGRGMAVYFLNRQAILAPSEPEMALLLFTGPLVATPSPTSGRMTFMTRSPLTGAIGDASVGGSFGTHLKKCGLDGLVLTGRSDVLCGIEIETGAVKIVSADQHAGKTTRELAEELSGKGATAVIGPAAENGVRFANVIIDGHYAAGRTGLGFAFAAKNIKYITVKGSRKVPVADPEGLKAACEDVFRLVSASPALMGRFGISRFGTAALYDLLDSRAMMPTDNFRKTRFSFAHEMNAPALHRRYRPESAGCRGCHIRCKKAVPDGPRLPEFETLSHFSALIGNRDRDTVMAANRICNETGMDTISAAVTLACHFEISGEPPYPNRIIELLEETAGGTGTGNALGRGAAAYARAAGQPCAAMTVKNLELPAYDPRGAYGMALAYAVSTRGGCHLRAYPISHEILRKPVPTDRFTFEGKARIIKTQEDANAAIDSLTACKFVFFGASLEEYARIYTAVTGHRVSGHDLLKAGERICFLERLINAENGFSAEDDDLPERFFTEPGDPGGPLTAPIDRQAFLAARQAYYSVRGLDENGLPTDDKARELGLA